MSIELFGDARAWFYERLTGCMASRGVKAEPGTVFYLVELLANLGTTSRHDRGRPLALLLADASGATGAERLRRFRELGDEALYVGGFFADHLEHRGVSADYVNRLGASAYETASRLATRSATEATRADVYRELASLFSPLTKVLDDVRESTALRTPQDIVRLYDKFRRTGSPRIAERLGAEGLYPTTPGKPTVH